MDELDALLNDLTDDVPVTIKPTSLLDEPLLPPLPTSRPTSRRPSATPQFRRPSLTPTALNTSAPKSPFAPSQSSPTSPFAQGPTSPFSASNTTGAARSPFAPAPNTPNPDDCSTCHQPVTGNFIQTFTGKKFHPEHMCCTRCNRNLLHSTYFEKEESLFCEGCFHDLYSPKCEYCKDVIKDRIITALGKEFHPEHFFCAQCGKTLGVSEPFMEYQGMAYCEDDYKGLFAATCNKCGNPLVDDYVEA
ncbi:hypothetical protein HK097_009962, partial [Rhizophlyctis rosea]